jgi:hypothetical protein
LNGDAETSWGAGGGLLLDRKPTHHSSPAQMSKPGEVLRVLFFHLARAEPPTSPGFLPTSPELLPSAYKEGACLKFLGMGRVPPWVPPRRPCIWNLRDTQTLFPLSLAWYTHPSERATALRKRTFLESPFKVPFLNWLFPGWFSSSQFLCYRVNSFQTRSAAWVPTLGY